MIQFSIKTHVKGNNYNTPHVFILNKGLNSGKPSSEPFTNCFVIQFKNQEDFENVNFIALALWKTKFWHPYLSGSVIPFLRINDVRKVFYKKVNQEIKDHLEHQKIIQKLRLLEQSENQFHQNLLLINELKQAILYRYCK